MKTTIFVAKNVAEFVEICSVYSDKGAFWFVGNEYVKNGKKHKNTATYISNDGTREVKVKFEM